MDYAHTSIYTLQDYTRICMIIITRLYDVIIIVNNVIDIVIYNKLDLVNNWVLKIHICSVSNMEMFNQASWPSPIGGRQVNHGI